MAERLTPEARQQAALFGQEVTKRGLPLGEKQAAVFAEFLLERNPPEGLLSRLASTVGFIDQQTLNNYFISMVQQAKQIVGEKPYYLALSDTGRSGQWVYEKLRELGLPPAQVCFAEIIEDGAVIDSKSVNPINKIYNAIARDEIVLALDDWAVGSMQMDEVLMNLPENCKPHVLLLAATVYAKHAMKSIRPDVSISIAKSEDIIMLDVILTDADKRFLNQLYEDTLGEEDSDSLGMYNILFASIHKTPDNVPDIFTGQRRMRGRIRRILPPLILPVAPPYEK